MSISNKKNGSKSSQDPIDVLIFEKGLRIKTLFLEKELDLLLIILNNGNLIKYKISDFKKLKAASQEELLEWELRNEGTGISWSKLDEDLSLYGFIKDIGLNARIKSLLLKSASAIIL